MTLADQPVTTVTSRIDEAIRCARCSSAVTHHSAAIAVDGAHEHTFRNPAGYSFQVACFAEAPGVRADGDPTTEATWFAGFAWQIGHCRTCGRHLGWWFRGTRTFAGLIVTRLA